MRKNTVAVLYHVANKVLQNSEILYLICSGRVLGTADMTKKLCDLSCFIREEQVITVVYKHPSVNYSDMDLEVYNYNKYKISDEITSNESIESIYGINNFNAIANLLNNLTFGSVAITINPDDYNSMVNRIEYPTPSTCSICHQACSMGEDIVSLVCCGHQFHNDCIYRQLTTSSVQCPICSMDVRSST